MSDDLLPGGLDADDVRDAFDQHDGNLSAVAREFDVSWQTVQSACIELELYQPEPSLATTLRQANGGDEADV